MKLTALIVLPVLIVFAWFASLKFSSDTTTKLSPQSFVSSSNQQPEILAPQTVDSNSKESIELVPNLVSTFDRFTQNIQDCARLHLSPQETLTALKAMYVEDPDALVDVMHSLGQMPLDVKQELLPLLGEALVLWSDVSGVYVAMLAYPYTEMAPSAAAGWAADFLTINDRADLVAASIMGNLAATDEIKAIELIQRLPEAAREKAIGSLADSIDLSDIDYIANLSLSIDPDASARLTKRIFDRLGYERLDETAAWLATNPDADK